MIYGILYTSVISDSFHESEIQNILNASRKNNSEQNISGILIYKAGIFIQYLEGERLAVKKLYAHITMDERHHTLRIIREQTTPSRLFATWDMAYRKGVDLDLPWVNRMLKLGAEQTEIQEPLQSLVDDL